MQMKLRGEINGNYIMRIRGIDLKEVIEIKEDGAILTGRTREPINPYDIINIQNEKYYAIFRVDFCDEVWSFQARRVDLDSFFFKFYKK